MKKMKKDILQKAINMCFNAHYCSVRKWDNQTPYGVHPLWCAMMFLQETKLPDPVNRESCALALLFHDVKEDTTIEFPEWLPRDVIELVESMTFTSEVGSTVIEMKTIWDSPAIVRLLKLYDKVSNLLDGLWMPDAKWNNQYVPYVLQLADDVEKNYGQLNIVRVAQAVAIVRNCKQNQKGDS